MTLKEELENLRTSIDVLITMLTPNASSLPIDDYFRHGEFPARAVTCFRKAKITRWSQLKNMSDADLLSMPSFGVSTLHEVREKITEHFK